MTPKVLENPVCLALRDAYMNKSSGELRVNSDSSSRRIFFLEGKLAFAMTTVRQERLGEILFKIGRINQKQYWDIHKLLENQNDKMGRILVKHEMISQKDLFFSLLYQVRTITLAVFNLNSGDWSFIQGTPAIPEDSVFSIDIPGVISEGMTKTRNLLYFQNTFLKVCPLLLPVNEDIRDNLRPEDIEFYNFLSRFPERDFQAIRQESKLDEDVFWRKTVLLYLLNLLNLRENKFSDDSGQTIEELIALFDKLKEGERDHYEILGVSAQAGPRDIKDAYFAMAKKYHPDRIGRAPDPDLKEKANFVFSRINKAYETLSDENRRREYDTREAGKVGQQSKIQENLGEKANVLFRKAKTLYNQQKYWEAASFLSEAVKADPGKPAYFLLLGLCQSQIPSMRRSAEQSLQTVVQMEPWNADALAALGLLFMKENLPRRAEGFFRKALSVNPEHQLSRRRLEEIAGPPKKSSWFSLGKKK